jgi:hypothetical protein
MLILGMSSGVGQVIVGGTKIVSRGEISCSNCHSDEVAEVTNTFHNNQIVEHLEYRGVDPPEVFTCITCHGGTAEWENFGLADWAIWYDNSSREKYSGEWRAFGYKTVPISDIQDIKAFNKKIVESTSYIRVSLESSSSGVRIRAKFTFFDYSGENKNRDIILSEESEGKYSGIIQGLYPDYFRLQIRANRTITTSQIIVESDGISTRAYICEQRLPDSTFELNRKYQVLGPIHTRKGVIPSDSVTSCFKNNLNFHTGEYSKVYPMTDVWEDVKKIEELNLPERDVPIDWVSIVGDEHSLGSCSATEGLCHTTVIMLKLTSNINSGIDLLEGYNSHYLHKASPTTDPLQICGTCHAYYFSDISPHEGPRCYDCHSPHKL